MSSQTAVKIWLRTTQRLSFFMHHLGKGPEYFHFKSERSLPDVCFRKKEEYLVECSRRLPNLQKLLDLRR